MSQQGISWRAHALVEKFDEDATSWVKEKSGLLAPSAADFAALNVKPTETVELPNNLLTTAGLTRVTSLINGAGGQAATATATRIGVGNGGGTAAIGDTDLSASAGSSNRWFQIMDATYPSTSAGVITFKSTFASADGNFAWNEWGIDIAAPTVTSTAVVGACLLNHKTSAALGTKTIGSSWAFTATITLS